MTLFLCAISFFAGAFFGVMLLAVLVAGKRELPNIERERGDNSC